MLAQTFTDFELIISDNCSTDDTEEIARRYAAADPRIRYVRQPRNRGSAYNHNVTVQHARGEFFKWLSDDDLYAPDLLGVAWRDFANVPTLCSLMPGPPTSTTPGTITHRLAVPADRPTTPAR